MSAKLREFLARRIAADGPLDVGAFMSHVLIHPELGYYTRKDPLGRLGDFTTAPEISQMFGEMIGAWAADIWRQMGAPARFILLEGGPGRGTLMADALRATAGVEGFHAALEVHLLEASPALRKLQARAVTTHRPAWHESLETLPKDRPVIMIANELLDALPVRQLEMTAQGWMERVVVLAGRKEEKGGLARLAPNLLGRGKAEPEFAFGLRACPPGLEALVPGEIAAQPGAIYEFSPARIHFIKEICARLKAQGGAALLIDYGHEAPQTGSSLHAIHNHEFVEPLSYIGDADLSAHVDFGTLKEAAQGEGAQIWGPAWQGEFLKALGIEARAAALKKAGDENQAAAVGKALQRLTAAGEMGKSYKVMGVSHEKISPAGF